MIKPCVALPCSLMLLALAQEASAQPGAAPGSPPPAPAEQRFTATALRAPVAPTRQWYGWQLLIGYGASDFLVATGIIAGIADGNFDGIPLPMILLSGTGIASQVLTSPIMHWSHGNVGRGFISLGLNGGLPAFGAGMGVLAGAGESSVAFPGFITGLFIGLAAGRAVDVALLAYDKIEPSSPEASNTTQWASSLTVVPIVGADMTGVGFAGLF